jgi:hypothetical protein
MSRFVTRIEMEAATSRTDSNKVAETILIPLLNEVYGWDLKNINYVEGDNRYPGIDLADEVAGISIQVTATPTPDKVKTAISEITLQRFWEPEGLNEYDTQDVIDMLVERSLARQDETGDISLRDLQYDSDAKDLQNFKQFLIPCSYYLNAACEICGSLTQLHPEQSDAIADTVREFQQE